MNQQDVISFTTGTPTYLFGHFSAYPFAILIGILSSILTICFFWHREKYSWDILLKLILITIPSSIIGARLFFIFERLIYDPQSIASSWWKIWEGGLSIHGGVLVPLILDLIYLRFKRDVVDLYKVFGMIMPAILIGQAIGRWGNFANHEVYGKTTSYEALKWLGDGIALNMNIDGSYRVPLFLIESFASFLGYILIVWVILLFGWTKPGTTGGIYLLYYGVVRTAMEPLREEAYLFYTLLSIASIIVGIILIVWFEWKGITKYNKVVVWDIKEIDMKKFKINPSMVMYVNKNSKYIQVTTSKRWINE